MQRHASRAALAILAAAVVALLGAPAAALAEIRQGTATDPIGDSAGAPSQDIVSARAQYDTNGQMTVSATMNGDIASGPRSFFSFTVMSFAPPAACTGSAVSMFGFSDSQYNTVTVTGVSGLGDSVIVRSGNTISYGASGNALRDRDYSCMTLSVSRPSEAGGGIVDQLNTPLFFVGYGPDGDGDGLKDNQDQCPAQAGPAPTGCPPAVAPPAATALTPTAPTATAPTATSPTRGRGTLSARVTPPADLRPAFSFTTSGRLTLPAGVSRAAGCNGRVSVQVKRGGTTISTRRVSLRANCTYSLRVSFASSRRFGTATRLKFTARFLGNALVAPTTAGARFARVRP